MRSRQLLTIAAALIIAGCTSSSTSQTVNALPLGNAILQRIVGVGDSLTAGEQSGGLLGATGVTSPVSGFPGGVVPPGQEFGFWSILYQQATFHACCAGAPLTTMFNPAVSPLPLIAGPGLGSQLVVTPTGSIGPSHSSCDAFNDAAFAGGSYGATRISLSQNVLDLGVPGITAHEALYMTGPLTGPPTGPGCTYPFNPADPSTALQPLVMSESNTFLPVLGKFGTRVSPLTEVSAAASLRPTLTTVWLGANDLLDFTFSGGVAPVDTPAQMQADIAQTIRTLQAAGSRVVVANVPDILFLPQFFRGGPTLTATLEAPPFSVPAGAAGPITNYIETTYHVGPGGFLTEAGFFSTLAQLKLLGSVTPVLHAPGDYLVDAFAVQVQQLNTAYNSAIAAAAQSSGAPLVDIHGLFTAIRLGGGYPVNPGVCCTLQFGGGLLSIDGLHPSNTGYAIIANLFIQKIDTVYRTTIPPLSPAQLLAISTTDPYAPPGFKKAASRMLISPQR
jgi:lysophospholipase L1-like esterase